LLLRCTSSDRYDTVSQVFDALGVTVLGFRACRDIRTSVSDPFCATFSSKGIRAVQAQVILPHLLLIPENLASPARVDLRQTDCTF
jgi:hypothetical protein